MRRKTQGVWKAPPRNGPRCKLQLLELWSFELLRHKRISLSHYICEGLLCYVTTWCAYILRSTQHVPSLSQNGRRRQLILLPDDISAVMNDIGWLLVRCMNEKLSIKWKSALSYREKRVDYFRLSRGVEGGKCVRAHTNFFPLNISPPWPSPPPPQSPASPYSPSPPWSSSSSLHPPLSPTFQPQPSSSPAFS